MSTSLETHIAECNLRYQALERRLDSVEKKIDTIVKDITDQKRSLASVIITSAGSIIVAIIGLIATLLIKF